MSPSTLGPAIDERYEDIAPIDMTGVTEVYRARHRVLGAVHALRVLRGTVGARGALRAAFIERARVQALLRHPAFVRVHNVYEEPDAVIVASEHLAAHSLADTITRDGPLPPERAVRVALTLAEGLEALHEAGMVHHELHGGSVLLDVATGAPRIGHLSLRLQSTGEGAAVSCASPEELVRPGAGDARADVHALGALLHHMLAGAPPFPLQPRERLLMARLGGERLPPLPGDPELSAIVRSATGDRVSERTQTAADLGKALSGWLARRAPAIDAVAPVVVEGVLDQRPVDETAVTLPLEPPTVATVQARKERARPAFGLAAVVLALGGVGVVTAFCVGGWLLWKERQRAESERLVGEVRSLLAWYKTDAAANEDASHLSRALGMAREAVDRHPSPSARGVHALALVWSDGWHYASAKWDEAKFTRADEVTRAALPDATAEGLLARGLLAGAACKLLPVGDARHAPHCAEAERQFIAAETLLLGDPRGWLRVELWWSQAVQHNRVARFGWSAGDTTAAGRAWANALAVCERARQDLAQAPVNDAELAQECVEAAGGVRRYDAWFAWSCWLQEDDRRDDGQLKSSNVETIYRGALPECSKLKFERNRKKKTLPKTNEVPVFYFCYAAGLQALGCPSQAAVVAQAAARFDPSLPWSELARAGAPECYLDVP